MQINITAFHLYKEDAETQTAKGLIAEKMMEMSHYTLMCHYFYMIFMNMECYAKLTCPLFPNATLATSSIFRILP